MINKAGVLIFFSFLAIFFFKYRFCLSVFVLPVVNVIIDAVVNQQSKDRAKYRDENYSAYVIYSFFHILCICILLLEETALCSSESVLIICTRRLFIKDRRRLQECEAVQVKQL